MVFDILLKSISGHCEITCAYATAIKSKLIFQLAPSLNQYSNALKSNNNARFLAHTQHILYVCGKLRVCGIILRYVVLSSCCVCRRESSRNAIKKKCQIVKRFIFQTYQVDIWSLGIILYRLCSLKYPWDDSKSSNYMRGVLKNDPNPIPKFYSSGVWDIIE